MPAARLQDTHPATLRQADLGSRSLACAGKSVSPQLGMLRTAIDESGWKDAAVACAIGVSPNYFSRMMSGEKPWTLERIDALPDDIEAIFTRLRAESFDQVVVVRVSEEDARRQFATGLFSLLTSAQLPARASAMARASLAPPARKVPGR